MRLRSSILIGALCCSSRVAATPAARTPASPYVHTLTRDVAIIGGGASGTYAAIKLRDAGRTVAIVEKADYLGGHAVTYTDPISKRPADYGVIVLSNNSIVNSYLSRLNVPAAPVAFNGENAKYFDFKSGEINPYYLIPDPRDALRAYAAHLAKYPFLDTGFNLPNPVPEDLLIPFGEFIEKYNLGGLSRIAFQWTQGFGDFLKVPTIYIMRYFNPRLLSGLTANTFISAGPYNISSLYTKAAKLLGEDVLYSSTVASTRRVPSADGYIKIIVDTPKGKVLLRAKRILITIPPLINNNFLNPFCPDSRETKIFKKFKHFNLWAAAVKDPAIPLGVSVLNVAPGNLTTPYGLAQMPAVYYFRTTPAPGIYATAYGTPAGMELRDEDVKREIQAAMQRLRSGGDLNTTTTEPANIVAFNSHSPYELTVSPKEIKAGFYKDLYALQGYQNTWWSGAAFLAHDSSGLWQFTSEIVDRLVAGLR